MQKQTLEHPSHFIGTWCLIEMNEIRIIEESKLNRSYINTCTIITEEINKAFKIILFLINN